MAEGVENHSHGLSQIQNNGSHVFSYIPLIILMALVKDENTEQQNQSQTVHIITNCHITRKTGGKPNQKGYGCQQIRILLDGHPHFSEYQKCSPIGHRHKQRDCNPQRIPKQAEAGAYTIKNAENAEKSKLLSNPLQTCA